MKQLIETVEKLRVRGIGLRSLTEALDATTLAGSDGPQAIALAGDDAPGVPTGVLVGFDGPALNDNDELAFVATVRRARRARCAIFLERKAAPADGGGRRPAAAHRRHDE